MLVPPFMQKVVELNDAMAALDYEKVERMLNDPEIPVNIDIFGARTPVETMLKTEDAEMARLFLNCSRVDWLSPSCDRNLLNLEGEFGIKYIPSDYLTQKSSCRVKIDNELGYFYYLTESFESKCPEEATIIYEKIIEEIVKIAKVDNYSDVLFKTANSIIAFKIALKYCSDVNCQAENGYTLLHSTRNFEVAKLIIQMGADLNAVAEREYTPFMMHADTEIGRLIAESGADLEFLSSSTSPGFWRMTPGNLGKFLDDFGLSEKLFRTLLSRSGVFYYEMLEVIFEKYPVYKDIFYSDLPSHLFSLQDPEGFDDLKVDSWSADDLERFMRKALATSSLSFIYRLQVPQTFLNQMDPNELLRICFKEDLSLQYELINEGRADPNSLVDGKTPLFVANFQAFADLLNAGADPFFKCDDYLFYERDDFCRIESWDHINAGFLFLLHRMGFDLFSRDRKSGKSLIDYLNPERRLVVHYGHGCFFFPIKKLSKRFFEVLSGTEHDFYDAVDDEGNTVAHYLLQASYSYLSEFSLSELATVKNRAGISVLEGMILSDPDLLASKYVKNLDDFKVYVDVFESCHGNEFKQRRCYYLMESLAGRSADFIKYLIEDKGVAIEVIMESKQEYNKPLDDLLFCEACRRDCKDVIAYLLEKGFEFENNCLAYILASSGVEFLLPVLDACADPEDFINCVCDVDVPFNEEAFQAFVQHPKIRQARPRNCQTDAYSVLDQCFFALCNKTRGLLAAGIDARKLIGTGAFAKVAKYDSLEITRIVEYLVSEEGWTRKDFENIFVAENCSIFNFFSEESSYFLSKFEELEKNVEA